MAPADGLSTAGDLLDRRFSVERSRKPAARAALRVARALHSKGTNKTGVASPSNSPRMCWRPRLFVFSGRSRDVSAEKLADRFAFCRHGLNIRRVRRSSPRPTALALIAVGTLVACVPRGEPPAGRQIVADRSSTPVGFVPSTGDGSTRVLVMRVTQDGSADLSVITLDDTGSAPVERLLASNFINFANRANGALGGNCADTDDRGRLLVLTDDSANPSFDLSRIDAVTGERQDLGPALACDLSASRRQLLVRDRDTATLYDANDQVTSLDARQNSFIGEDLYYVSSQHQLMRRSADGAASMLADDVQSFTVESTDSGPAILLRRSTSDGSTTSGATTSDSMLDVSTETETPLSFPQNASVSLSPDGRWFFVSDWQTSASTFLDWRTGEQRPIDITAEAGSGNPSWRPGRDEVWFTAIEPGGATTSVRTPDGGAFDAVLWPVQENQLDTQTGSIFTADGTYVFSVAPEPPAGAPAIQVGSADDPSAPRFDLAPAGSAVFGYWRLADGRLLVSSGTVVSEIADISAVDPTTGDRSALGEQGQVLAVGESRSLVNQHLVEHAGDLTVFDLATARATVLAPEFAVAAVVEATGGDAVAPGAGVAFRFEARFPSPYDGIWLTTAP